MHRNLYRAVVPVAVLTVLAACGGSGNSAPPPVAPPPPPSNNAPTASITASATTVEERRSFELSASRSSDPDGDTITYRWAQTAGTAVTIADATAETLNLEMPETDADETLTFELTVSDGTANSVATIDIVNSNIVISPVNMMHVKLPNSTIDAVNRPKSFYNFVRPDVVFQRANISQLVGVGARDDGTATYSRWQATTPNGQTTDWGAPEFTIDIPGITLGAEDDPILFEFSSQSTATFPFGTFANRRIGIHFEAQETLLLIDPDEATPVLTNRLDVPGACRVSMILDPNPPAIVGPGFSGPVATQGYVTIANSAGGLFQRTFQEAGGTYTFGPVTELEATGDYCTFVQDLNGTVISLNETTREFRVRQFDGTTTVQTFDQNDSAGLDVVTMDLNRGTFTFGPSKPYLFLLLSEGTYDGRSKLLIYSLEQNGSMTFETSYDFTKGVPVRTSFSFVLSSANDVTQEAYVRFADIPAVAHIVCQESRPEYCYQIQFIDAGFDVSDVMPLGSADLNTDLRQVLISKETADEMTIWDR